VQVAAETADVTQVPVEFTEFSSETAMASELLTSVKASGGGKGGVGGGFGGRGKGREALVKGGGGSGASEAAVDASIKWIFNHQLPDGSWTFAHDKTPSCNGQCSHPGKYRDNAGATAMALLPMLGRGYSHKEGPYKKQIEAGITYLANLAAANGGKAFLEPSHGLYVQGLAGIVLSEAYAMSQDQRLKLPAQAALNYIMAAQDPVGGGWRYYPRQPGDTSAVGWQLMALKSGHMAYLQVNPLTIKKAADFLDSVQTDSGSAYGYEGPGNQFPTTAVGLLCRMYMGWKKDNPALERGVARMAKRGPTSDIYYDYYATQIMHHMEGDVWTEWNAKMRDGLINAQSKQGHEAGSWFEGYNGGLPHSAEYGGRLYVTSMATMILEVYYRHLPLYGSASVEEEFKE
jgi:hypothetical protein